MAEISTDNFFVDMEENLGLYALKDTTKAPIGSARIMENTQVTDRGGVGPRPGIKIIGNRREGSPITGFYNFQRSFAQDELLIRAIDDKLEVKSKQYPDVGWSRIKTGLTSGKSFGFATALVNDDDQDYVVGGNRFDKYLSWTGSVAKVTNVDNSGSTSIITTDSNLTNEIYYTIVGGDITSSSTTTVTVSGADWATDQWKGFYLYIKSGTESNKVTKITANTADQLTFEALGSDPGGSNMEIRKLKFNESGSIHYDGGDHAYDNIDVYNKITLTNDTVSDLGDELIVQNITEHPDNPRGNRFTNYLSRIIVGRVRSARARGSGGALQGYSAGGSVFVSHEKDPLDFTYDANRNAGQGDIIGVPQGGGEITDVAQQEKQFYIFKKNYIETASYSQDTNDVVVREPLKSGAGSVGRVIQGSDDVYFITQDNQFTSLGRVKSKDARPETKNIGQTIKRILDKYSFTDGKGIEWQDKIYIPAKSDPDFNYNDVVIIFDRNQAIFEGIWNLNAGFFDSWDGNLVFSDSSSPNVYQALVGTSDDIGKDKPFPVEAKYATHFMNLASNKGMQQAVNKLYVEGYIKQGTKITFQMYKDLNNEPFLSFDFTGDSGTLSGETISASLGTQTYGLQPKGTIGEQDDDGRAHFFFYVYFPFQYGNNFSFGFESSGINQDYEITRFGLGLKETTTIDSDRVVEASNV